MSLVIAALLVSAQAAADSPAATPAEATSPAPAKVKEKKICKEDDLVSGSRMARRICLTQSEWDQRNRGMVNSARSGFSGKAEDH